MSTYLLSGLLIVCWIAALATLLVFLESWFSAPGRNRFVARRASGAYGVVTLFVPMYGRIEDTEAAVRSVFEQTYPFIELFLIHSEDDADQANLARELRSLRSHVRVQTVSVATPLATAHDRVRALERIQPLARGRWYVAMESGLRLDRMAIEAALEFAGSGEVVALSLRSGMHCTSMVQRLLAPSMEYFSQMIRVVERRREPSPSMVADSAFLLINRDAFEVVNGMNRMPGILNEAGWNIWSYQVEGLRTFEGDGSRWMWRPARVDAWSVFPDRGRRFPARSSRLIVAGTITALIPVAGLAYGFLVRSNTFLEGSIFAVSAASYALMAVSYYLHARKLHAATWFAPLWFLSHTPASLLTFLTVRRAAALKPQERSQVVNN